MGRLKIFHRFISKGNVSCERTVHRPHKHKRLIVHFGNQFQKILIARVRNHIPNILTHKRRPPRMPARRPRLSQMIRQFLRSIITYYLLGKRQFPIKMILKRILRRLPRRRPSPRQNLLRRTPKTRPRRRHIRRPHPILRPLLIIPPRLIHIRRHIPPRNRRPAHATIKSNRFGIIKLREPLQRRPRLRSRQTPHTTPRHTRITLSTPQIYARHLPAHIRERPTQTICPLGD